MTSALLLELTFKITLLFGGAFTAARLMRRSSAASRHLVWMLATVSALLLPWLPKAAPRWRGFPDVSFTTGASAGAPVAAVAELAPTAWFAGTLLVLAHYAFAYIRLAFLVRRARAAAGFRETPEPVSPFVWGPAVVLPATARHWDDSLRNSVLVHERSHISRGDSLWLALSQLACAVYWFHPLAWYAKRQAAEEAERACDDAVLRQGADGTSYARQLLTVARQTLAPEAAPSMTGASPFERRIASLLDGAVNRSGLSARFAAAAFLGCLLVTVPLAALQGAAPKEEIRTKPRLVYKVEPAYTEEARDAKIEGRCVLSLAVDEDGLPQDIRVIETLDPGLDANAILAVRQWRFSPASVDGKPVRVSAAVEVLFRLY
jgi:TonB family protein